MENNEKDWMSVSEYAKKVGKSNQWVYNMIRDGKIESMSFQRGKYNGLLVKARIPKNV